MTSQYVVIICSVIVRWSVGGGRNMIVVRFATSELELDPL